MSERDAGMDGTPQDRDAVLAAEFVLRLLDPAGHAAAAARAASDPRFAADVARWRADLEPLDAEYDEAAPSAALRGRVEARLFGRAPSLLARLWAAAGLWRGLAAVAAAAALWFALPAAPPPQPPAPGARLVSALAPVDGGAELLALYEADTGALSLSRVAGRPGPGRDFELWVIFGEAAPISLGVLPAREVTRLELPGEIAARIAAGAVLAVTDEPAGGSPTNGPTGALLAAGPLRAV